MIERVPIIVAAEERLFERHVEVLLRAESITAMSFPSEIAGHRLSAVKSVKQHPQDAFGAVLTRKDSWKHRCRKDRNFVLRHSKALMG